ncbi:MAG: hypothetical protein AAFQ05_10345 [Pseudomonadota bacterium]
MGVDYAAAKKLVQLSAKFPNRGRVLMLGRHKLRMVPKHRSALERVMTQEGLSLSYTDLQQEDGYAERFFHQLGYTDVVSMDFSDYEGAEIIHDLNEPVPDELKGQFDLIFDGGTTEHVFDVATCMRNLFDLLAPAGILVGCSPANGWLGHGFYQFGPELVYGFWKLRMGCEVIHCSILPERLRHKEIPLKDNIAHGNRIRFYDKVPKERVYLYYEVQKGIHAGDRGRTLQSDYVAKWNRFDAAQGREDTDIMKLRQQHMKT